MAIAIALLGFNDFGRSVTSTFLFRNRFYLQLSPHCSKMNKKSMWEDFCPRDMESCHLAAARRVKLWSRNANLFNRARFPFIPLCANRARFLFLALGCKSSSNRTLSSSANSDSQFAVEGRVETPFKFISPVKNKRNPCSRLLLQEQVKLRSKVNFSCPFLLIYWVTISRKKKQW